MLLFHCTDQSREIRVQRLPPYVNASQHGALRHRLFHSSELAEEFWRVSSRKTSFLFWNANAEDI